MPLQMDLPGLIVEPGAPLRTSLLRTWADSRDIALTRAPGHGFPAPDRYAFVAVLAMPTARLVAWLRAVDATGVPVLAIGAGAQALALALGGGARTQRPVFVGWTEVASADAHRVPAGPWATWQGHEMVAPPLAYELARDERGTQAFCVRRHLAVRFQAEATADVLVAWAAELAAAGHDADRLLGPAPPAAAAHQLFDGFAARAGLAVA